MRNRRLTVLWLVVFAAQAAGLTHALHLAIEDHCCNEGAACQDAPSGHSHAQSQCDTRSGSVSKATHPGHDPLHCAICQALAGLKAMPLPTIANFCMAIPPSQTIHIPSSSEMGRISIDSLGPRAPPAAQFALQSV